MPEFDFGSLKSKDIFEGRLKEIAEEITKATGLTEKEIHEQLTKIREELKGLISKEGALEIMCNELGVDIPEEEIEIEEMDTMEEIEEMDTMEEIEEIDIDEEPKEYTTEILVITDHTMTTRTYFHGEWHIEDYERGQCMSCDNPMIAGQTGTCPVCDQVMSQEEFEEKFMNKSEEMEEIDMNIEEIEIEEEPQKEEPIPKVPSHKEITDSQAQLNPSNGSYIIGLVGEKGTGKTKCAGDFTRLLSKDKKMLYFDSESKADKVLREWFNLDKIDLINFTKIDLKTGKTLKSDTLEEFEKVFQDKWIPLLKSGKYEFLTLDKGNVFREMAKEWYYENTPKPKPAQFAWAEIYNIMLSRIFEPIINICRHYGVNVILCFNIKDEYKNDKQVGVKANAHDVILDHLDYYLWLEPDYEKYVLKHPIKAYWCLRDEDVNVTKYLFNREFILEGKAIKNRNGEEIVREFKRYADFMEESMLSTYKQRIRKKKASKVEEIDLNIE